MRLPGMVAAALLLPGGPLQMREASLSHSRNARYDLTVMERRTFEAINRQRRDRGYPNLIWNDALAGVARQHSASMAERHYFSHVDPVSGGLAARLDRAGIRWKRSEENIFNEKGYKDPVKKAVQSWMGGPVHRRSILNGGVTETGIGIGVASDRTLCFTQDFIRP